MKLRADFGNLKSGNGLTQVVVVVDRQLWILELLILSRLLIAEIVIREPILIDKEIGPDFSKSVAVDINPDLPRIHDSRYCLINEYLSLRTRHASWSKQR